MRIYVDHSKLTDAPYSKKTEGSFDFSWANRLISDTSSEIVHGSPTCLIVSGYRGAGKTSFFKRLQTEITEESKVVFVEINLPERIETNFLLRRIIRRIYLALSDHKKASQYLKNKTPNVLQGLETLFQKTFHEVTEMTKHSSTNEAATEAKSVLDIKSISITIGLSLFGLITSKYELLTALLNFSEKNLSGKLTIDEIPYLLPILYIVYGVSKAQLNITRKRKRQELSEKNVKSLYDDEIAEDHLRRVLTDISESQIKIVFIIDELDKIEKEADLEGLIRAIKPLMLSGLASFLLITGQRFYYKFHSGHTSDDAIIASLFSKSIHVPLLSIGDFRKLFQRLVIETNDISEEFLDNFVNSVVLESNRIPRRFYNIIRQRISWDGNKAYLEVDPANENVFRTHSNLLDIIQNIEQKLAAPEYKEGIKDFFISQLHLMIQKMLARSTIPFTRQVLCDTERDELPEIPEWCKIRLDEIANSLLDACVSSGMLHKDSEPTESGDKEIYTWTEPADAAIELPHNDPRKVESVFLQAFTDLERLAREICLEIESRTAVDQLDKSRVYRSSVMEILGRLVEHELFPPERLADLKPAIEMRNRLVHRSSLKLDELKSAGESGAYLTELRHQLLYNFTFQVLSRKLEAIAYQLGMPDPHYDILGLGFSFRGTPTKDKERPDFLFDIKFDPLFVSNPNKSLEFLLRRAEKYGTKVRKKTVAIAFLFVPPGTLRENDFQLNKQTMNSKCDDAANCVFIRILSESLADPESLTLEQHLDDILTTTEVSSFTEVASSDKSARGDLPEA